MSEIKVINPATEEVIAQLKCDDELSVQGKYNKALQYQNTFKNTAQKDRISIVSKFHDLLLKNIEDLAQILTKEVGKPISQSRNEIKGAASRIKFFIEESAKYLTTEIVRTIPASNMIEKIDYEPIGVVANISAWNYPYLVGMNVLIPSLIAGNPTLYKPSEFALMTGTKIVALLQEAGFSTDAIQLIIGDGTIGSAVANLPLAGLFFTGSVSTGKKINQAMAKNFSQIGLELGGKDPVYVMDDADILVAAASLADGAFYNNGQSCCSVERIYVHEKSWDTFLNKFVEEVKSFKLGNPLLEDTYLGALTRRAQIEVLDDQVSDAVNKGAQVLLGGKAITGKGNFYEPTILINVNHQMKVMKEESFGPIIGLMKVKNDEEALQLMNDSIYGLTSGVYGRNQERALKLMAQLNSGTVYWNCCDRVSPYLPWSGRNQSGQGSTLSHLGIKAFVRPKAYHLNNAYAGK